MVQVYVMSVNPRYGTSMVGAYYDGDVTFADVVKDLEANQFEIRRVIFEKRGSMSTFIIEAV